MQRTQVTSSNISSIGYQDGTLEIQFNSGEIYQYTSVPLEVYQNLMNASSHGTYLNSFIKGNYQYYKL